jgi:hypothetical protein
MKKILALLILSLGLTVQPSKPYTRKDIENLRTISSIATVVMYPSLISDLNDSADLYQIADAFNSSRNLTDLSDFFAKMAKRHATLAQDQLLVPALVDDALSSALEKNNSLLVRVVYAIEALRQAHKSEQLGAEALMIIIKEIAYASTYELIQQNFPNNDQQTARRISYVIALSVIDSIFEIIKTNSLINKLRQKPTGTTVRKDFAMAVDIFLAFAGNTLRELIGAWIASGIEQKEEDPSSNQPPDDLAQPPHNPQTEPLVTVA